MKLYKIGGTGNTFFFLMERDLIDNGETCGFDKSNRSELAKIICKSYGTGADGLVIVKTTSPIGFDYEWDFYNNDGSSAEMCGNASRCMALFVRDYLGFKNKQLIFKSIAGEILVKYLENNLFRVKMTDHKLINIWKIEKINSTEMRYCSINTGVPHAVIQVANLNHEDLLQIVKMFRFKDEYGSAGANVSFFCENQGNYEGITFERGVEGFTQSCGTGVVSMALAIFNLPKYLQSNQNKIVKIRTPGGELMVELDNTEKFCWLTGPAEFIEYVECLPKAIRKNN